MNDDKHPFIYESPDGGHTVYRRHLGHYDHRELVSVDKEAQSKLDTIKEDKLWGDIRRKEDSDSAIREMLDQLRIYYNLKYGKD